MNTRTQRRFIGCTNHFTSPKLHTAFRWVRQVETLHLILGGNDCEMLFPPSGIQASLEELKEDIDKQFGQWEIFDFRSEMWTLTMNM